MVWTGGKDQTQENIALLEARRTAIRQAEVEQEFREKERGDKIAEPEARMEAIKVVQAALGWPRFWNQRRAEEVVNLLEEKGLLATR